jgi:hypothetical protein
VSRPILMYPSFRVAIHIPSAPPPPPQGVIAKGRHVCGAKGRALPGIPRPGNASQHLSCWPLAAEFPPALPPTAGAPWHVGAHEDLSKLPQAPDAEGILAWHDALRGRFRGPPREHTSRR